MKHIVRFTAAFYLVFLAGCTDKKPLQPNIIVIMSDDIGYSDIGCYGSEIKTPNLDMLAENGLKFTQFYNTSRCCPTRASLLTGLYPHQAGMGHMVFPRGNEVAYQGDLNENCLTIAQVLKTAGYKSYMTGKWHVTPLFPTRENPDKHNWPLQRGFDRFFGTIDGAGSFFDPNSLTSGNTFVPPGEDFYYTDAISDTTVKYINENNNDQPFFIYVAYTAAHWPQHALPEDIAKYAGKYDNGWEPIRSARIEKMRSLGLIKPEWDISEPCPGDDWEVQDEKEFHSRCMEVYAAMIDNMDQGIGRIVDALEKKGILENTLIFYLQDNGACPENFNFDRKELILIDSSESRPMAPGEIQYEAIPIITRDGLPVRAGYGVMPGPADTYVGYDLNWANVGNVPFRMFKHWVHEGGISTPLIIHWPSGVKDKGSLREQPGHLIDIMATCVDVSGATYPELNEENEILPMEGTSLVPAFENKKLEREALFWEHQGNRAIRIGKWKLVSESYLLNAMIHDTVDILDLTEWRLYDLENDRTETNNVALEYPERVNEMSELWLKWAEMAKVLPKPRLEWQ